MPTETMALTAADVGRLEAVVEPLFHLEIVEQSAGKFLLDKSVKLTRSSPSKSIEEVRTVALEASKKCSEVRIYRDGALAEVYRKGVKS